MKLEIVEFYPILNDFKNKILKGTLHIYFPDWDIDLRGFYVLKKGDKWIFLTPTKTQIDQETGEKVQYPVFSFAKPETFKKLLKELQIKGKDYIVKNYILKSK